MEKIFEEEKENNSGGITDSGTPAGDTGSQPGNPRNTTSVAQKAEVRSIRLSGISNKIAAGKKIKLTAGIFPSDALDKQITWSSSDTKIAKVSQSGVVKIKKKTGGKSVVITATAANGVEASYRIKSMKGAVKKVTVAGAKTVNAGKSIKLKAKVTATKGANKKLLWMSSNPEYAVVSARGQVKAAISGKGKKVKITAMSTDGSNKKKSVTIRIK